MSHWFLRAAYVAGRITIEEFERQLDELLTKDPDALDRQEPRITDRPGSIIYDASYPDMGGSLTVPE